MIVRSALSFMLLVLSACDNETADGNRGGVSAEDARALDAAAEKLDAEAAGTPQ